MYYLLVFSCIVGAQTASYNSSLYTLGSNLITNHNFSLPVIPNGTAYSLYSGSIASWTCKNICDVKNIPETCSISGVPCDVNFTKGIDLDTNNSLHTISQAINFNTTGSYYLHIDWMPAFDSPIGR